MTAEPRSHSGVVVFPWYWAQGSGSGPMACRPRSVSGLSECGCFRRQPVPGSGTRAHHFNPNLYGGWREQSCDWQDHGHVSALPYNDGVKKNQFSNRRLGCPYQQGE